MNDDAHFASIFPNEEEESTNEEDDNLKAEPHFVKRKVHTELDDEKEVNIDEISSSTALINKLLFLVLTQKKVFEKMNSIQSIPTMNA